MPCETWFIRSLLPIASLGRDSSVTKMQKNDVLSPAGVPSLVGSRSPAARLKGSNDDFPGRRYRRRHGVAFFIRALSARTLSQARVPHHSKRACSNPRCKPCFVDGNALFETASCELRPAGQMKSVGYEISLHAPETSLRRRQRNNARSAAVY